MFYNELGNFTISGMKIKRAIFQNDLGLAFGCHRRRVLMFSFDTWGFFYHQ